MSIQVWVLRGGIGYKRGMQAGLHPLLSGIHLPLPYNTPPTHNLWRMKLSACPSLPAPPPTQHTIAMKLSACPCLLSPQDMMVMKLCARPSAPACRHPECPCLPPPT